MAGVKGRSEGARPMDLYWHGGPAGLYIDDWILPAADTGVTPAVDFYAEQLRHPAMPAGIRAQYLKDRVYLMGPDYRGKAALDAIWRWEHPRIYRVRPFGDVRVDESWGTDGIAFHAARARVVEVHRPTQADRRMSQAVIAGLAKQGLSLPPAVPSPTPRRASDALPLLDEMGAGLSVQRTADQPWPALLQTVRRYAELPLDGIHGVRHWARVAYTGRRLAAATGADPTVVELFAIFHDARRRTDGHDPDHGTRGAELARFLEGEVFTLDEHQLEVLCDACTRHTDGATDPDQTITACWDADRLDLGRVGIEPDPARLGSAAARRFRTEAYLRGVGGYRATDVLTRWGVHG